MSVDRQMDREDVVHIYNGILLSHKKNNGMPLAVMWMDTKGHVFYESVYSKCPEGADP